jgi:hypothetical protein
LLLVPLSKVVLRVYSPLKTLNNLAKIGE